MSELDYIMKLAREENDVSSCAKDGCGHACTLNKRKEMAVCVPTRTRTLGMEWADLSPTDTVSGQ